MSEEQGNTTLNCSNLDAIIDILEAKLVPVQSNPDMHEKLSNKKTSGKYCQLKPDVSIRVKTKCQFGNSCSLSIKSIINGDCPNQKYNLKILYKCVKNSQKINSGQF